MNKENKDYTRWNRQVYKLKSISDFFLIDNFDDGIYSFGVPSCNLDILIKGIKKTPTQQRAPCLVFFGGALTGRPIGVNPPFFSGIGIASSTSLPLISISDPTLSFSDSLLLSWYAGNDRERSLPIVLSAILDHISEKYYLKLILVGGSGGGFAALSQACLLRCTATVVVWNPQTDIAAYDQKAVIKYLSAAFQESIEENLIDLEEIQRRSAIKAALDSSGIFYSLINKSIPIKMDILYLQNVHDWHVLSHAKPFLINRNNEWRRVGKSSFSNSKNIALHFGDWGPGHAGPPGELIGTILKKITAGDSSVDVATFLSTGPLTPEYTHFFSADNFNIEGKFSAVVSESSKGCKITIEPSAGILSENLEYAIYVFVNGIRNVYWYQPSKEFEVPFHRSHIEGVRIFIRDIWQDIRWCHASKGAERLV